MGKFSRTGVYWQCFYCPQRDLRWFTFNGEAYFGGGSLEDFGKSDMKRGGKFGLIAVEYFLLENVLL